jgi:lipoyl(octanoyl) transferase
MNQPIQMTKMNTVLNKKTQFIDLGLIDYKEAWDYQVQLFERTLALKSQNRNLPEDQYQQTPNYLIFCEHPHVYTLGKSGDQNNLLINDEFLKNIGATYYQINRGGDITYHGPGQIVGYPIFDLDNFFTDIHQYMRLLEEAVIQTLGEYKINGGRIPGLTGVWIDHQDKVRARKICAFGVKTSRWVTMHGLALNVNTNLPYFDYIVPCGIQDKAVTSMAKELGSELNMEDVKRVLKEKFSELFQLQWI